MSSSRTEALPRLAVLISGGGSNMVAIARACQEGRIPARIVLVLSDIPEAAGLARARELGLHAVVVDRRAMLRDGRQDRQAFEAEVEREIEASGADYIILAGFMRVLSERLVQRYRGRMLNIHPSLLPRHKGLDTHARALAAGDSEHGASVHFVTPELDGGPLIAQSAVEVLPGDTVASLSARVHAREHILYPMVLQWLTSGRLEWNAGDPRLDGVPLARPARIP
ncbi:MAG TPA: phosphoribosylglycinamide formyltransferase [Steroidobacteraceae bacterium]|nr:phosphoribosylglycinamide formyltransferase [Steroidobacteraceae bacterium]